MHRWPTGRANIGLLLEDLRFRLCRFDLVPRRCRFLPTTGLGSRYKVRLRRHLPLHRVLRKVIVIIPRTRADTRLRTEVFVDDRIVRRIRVQDVVQWSRRWSRRTSYYWIGSNDQHAAAIGPLDRR